MLRGGCANRSIATSVINWKPACEYLAHCCPCRKLEHFPPKQRLAEKARSKPEQKARAAWRCFCGFISLCGATDTHCRKAIVWPLETNASSLPKQALVPEERLLFSYEILRFLQHYWHFRAGVIYGFRSSVSLASPCMAVKIGFFCLGCCDIQWQNTLCLTGLILLFVWCYCSYWMELEYSGFHLFQLSNDRIGWVPGDFKD